MSPGRAAAAGLVLVLLSACTDSGGDQATRNALVHTIRSAAGTSTPVKLADVVDGDWTRLVLACPYEDREVVEGRLGFAWEDFPGQDDTEGSATYIFATSSDVTTWATLGRGEGDPCGESDARRDVPRSSAVFRVTRAETAADGRPFHTLVQQR